jgi:anaphase-promoting complex subunit 2
VGEDAFQQDDWEAWLDFCTAECFCLVRFAELFDIIADYPDSHAAVAELQMVLETTNMQMQLGEMLQASLKTRCIHPGANTSQIIEVYINAIKVWLYRVV